MHAPFLFKTIVKPTARIMRKSRRLIIDARYVSERGGRSLISRRRSGFSRAREGSFSLRYVSLRVWEGRFVPQNIEPLVVILLKAGDNIAGWINPRVSWIDRSTSQITTGRDRERVICSAKYLRFPHLSIHFDENNRVCPASVKICLS